MTTAVAILMADRPVSSLRSDPSCFLDAIDVLIREIGRTGAFPSSFRSSCGRVVGDVVPGADGTLPETFAFLSVFYFTPDIAFPTLPREAADAVVQVLCDIQDALLRGVSEVAFVRPGVTVEATIAPATTVGYGQ